MRYEFESGPERRIVECPMDEIGEMTVQLAHIGWRRVYTAPQIIVTPGYWEAMEESDRLADDPYGGGRPSREMQEATDFRQFTPKDFEHLAEDENNA